MIIAQQSDFKKYVKLNPHFKTVCEFLENTDLQTLTDGRIDIDGDNVFANCMTYVADGVLGQQFETHKKYLDIHIVIENMEAMAVTTIEDSTLKQSFNVQDDIGFYNSNFYQTVILTEHNLLVTFEEDFHQPKGRVNDEPVKKLVIKVLNEGVCYESE